jgi:hypothetical protein
VGIFCLSDELRLRLVPGVGILEDLYVGLMVVLAVGSVWRRPSALLRLRLLLGPVAFIAVLAGLYLLDPARWFFGSRLLWEVLGLWGTGLLGACPEATTRHLVHAMTVFPSAEPCSRGSSKRWVPAL